MPVSKIRLATSSDVLPVVHLIDEFVENSVYSGIELDIQDVTQWVINFIEGDDSQLVIFVLANEEDTPVGFLMATCASQHPILGRVKLASEIGFWVTEEYRSMKAAKALLDAFEEWAKIVEADKVVLSTLSDNAGVGKIYERRGFKETEISYMKDIR